VRSGEALGVSWTQVESNLLRVIRRSFIATWGHPIVVRDARPIEDSSVGVLSPQRRFSGDVSASGLWFLPGKQYSQVQALPGSAGTSVLARPA
jgi:hypothetical protein